MKLSHAVPLIAAMISGMLIAADLTKKTWDFEKDESGRIAKGFTNEVGQWEVANDGDNHVLYQKAKNGDATFNVALVEGSSCKDIDLSVKLKATAGEVDRGGGLVGGPRTQGITTSRGTTRWRTTSACTRSRTESVPSSSRPVVNVDFRTHQGAIPVTKSPKAAGAVHHPLP